MWRNFEALGVGPCRKALTRSHRSLHGGVLFVQSANQIQALDGATGSLLWRYVRPLADSFRNGRQAIAKNMAIYGERIFAPTA